MNYLGAHNSIVVAGSLAQRAGRGGHTWVFLQYLLGLRRLGWDVLFLDELPPHNCVDEQGNRCSPRQSRRVRYFVDVMERFGLSNACSLRLGRDKPVPSEQVIGLPRAEVLHRVKKSAALLNFTGYLGDPEILAAAPRRIYFDIDPGFAQMRHALGGADVFTGYDDFVTIGENIGLPGCEVPTCGLPWITTPQPVVLEHWPTTPDRTGHYSSIATWRGAFGPIDFRGNRYGQRVEEFRKFLALPRRTGRSFQLAMNLAPHEVTEAALLQENGWVLDDPRVVAGDPWAYRSYVQSSRAEFMVAKNLYVETRGGWFSDRSICYLASGKPVIVQDTGLAARYPERCGLFLFSTLDEAAAAVTAVEGDYPRHSRGARILAEEFFDSDRVLSQLLGKLRLG